MIERVKLTFKWPAKDSCKNFKKGRPGRHGGLCKPYCKEPTPRN
jgi:hypothetical protein